jgi:hypothetical protein
MQANFELEQTSAARLLSYAIAAMVLVAVPRGWTSPASDDAVQRGQAFLVRLFDTNMSLLPEYPGANVYWLFHDNYLASKVLAGSHPEMTKSIVAAIQREGISKSGKIELIFGEADKPLPFRQYKLMDVRHVANKVIRTEVVTDSVLNSWEDYADLLLLASIAETNRPAARKRWEDAMRMWDGKGFMDAAARHDSRYSTYKLALALLAAGHLSPPATPPQELIDRLLSMQDGSGGWITDYDATGKKIGLANVETTCLSILGLEALIGHKQFEH